MIATLLLTGVIASGTGCFWIALGGAGAVGYEVAKDDRSIGTKLSDASVTSSIKTKFALDELIDAVDINVDTFDGVVTLHGHVRSHDARSRAIALARSVKGVKEVRSKLVILAPASR